MIMARTALVLAAAALLLTGCTAAKPDAPVVVPEQTPIDFQVGDCIDDSTVDGENFSNAIDCTEPHDSEAYATLDMFEGDGSYPGREAIFAEASRGCEAAFYAFVGIIYDESLLTITYFYPSADSWDDGDRAILCLIQDTADGENVESTGSLRGVAR